MLCHRHDHKPGVSRHERLENLCRCADDCVNTQSCLAHDKCMPRKSRGCAHTHTGMQERCIEGYTVQLNLTLLQ